VSAPTHPGARPLIRPPLSSVLREHCQRHIAIGEDSVFDYIQEMQSVASTIAFNQPATANTCTSRDGKYIQHRGFVVEVARLTAGIQKMLEDLQAKMYGLSGGTKVKYSIPKDHVDDLSSTGRGSSWMRGCRTEPATHALMLAMIDAGRWNLSEKKVGRGLRWNRVACQHFLETAAEIVDLLITLIHLGGGPPVRGEELVRDQISNGIQLRTLYMTFGQMLLIRRRSKDTNRRGIDAFNVCYLPECLKDALCYYLLVIRPLEKAVAWEMYGSTEQSLEYDLHLYVRHGKRMTSEQFSTTLQKNTEKYIGAKLSITPTRHIMIAFMRAYLEPKVVEKGNNIGDLMSSHGTQTALHIYAPEMGNLEGVTDALLADVREFCEHYHDAIGLGERTGPLISVRTKRAIAQKLVLAASMDPGDPGMLGVVGEMLERLGETAFRAGLEQLKSEVVKEIWHAVSEGLERVISEKLLSARSVQAQPPARSAQAQAPARSAEAQPPARLAPAHSEPQATSRPANAPQMPTPEAQSHKRQLSGEKAEPAYKRVQPEPETPRTRSDSGTVYPQYNDEQEHAPDLPDAPTTTAAAESEPDGRSREPQSNAREDTVNTDLHGIPWETPDTLTEPDRTALPTIEEDSNQDAQVTSALDRMSSMSLRPYADEDQPQESAQPQEAPAPIRQTVPPEDRHLSALRRYLRDPLAELRGKQKELLEAIDEGNHVVAVLPTGSGKSVAYEIPALYNERITIVGIPYRLVISQALRNAMDHGRSAEIWYSKTPKTLTHDLRLILVPYESLLTDSFSE